MAGFSKGYMTANITLPRLLPIQTGDHNSSQQNIPVEVYTVTFGFMWQKKSQTSV
jgi:hypothetical protein